MLGLWPSCSYKGCQMPALLQLQNTQDGRRLAANVCLVHVVEAQRAVEEMKGIRTQDLAALEHEQS